MSDEINSISVNISENEFTEKPNHKKLALILLAVFIGLSAVLIAAYFLLKPSSYLNPSANPEDILNQGNSANNGKMAYENPVNGVLFSEEEASKFKDLKPIAVMVNNYLEARPSSGLNSADIVYEAVAEAGITRLMPIFYSKIPDKVMSVRSARYYFVELASAYHPHYIHWGAAFVPACQKAGTCINETNPDVDAYNRIVKLGLPNLDGGNYACGESDTTCVFTRDAKRMDAGVPQEHTAYVRLPLVYDLAKRIRPDEAWHKFTPIRQWKFKDEAQESERGDTGITKPIEYLYWDTMKGFNVKWDYDKKTNEYIRYQGGVKQTDALDNKELRAKTVIVRFTKQAAVGDKKHHLYHTIVGTGKSLIFMNGKVVESNWDRSTHEMLDIYKDINGNEIEFPRGQIWVQLIPDTNIVTY